MKVTDIRRRPIARHATRLWLEPLESRELLTTPLPDLGPGLYKGYEGGLYPDGQDTRPPAHEAYGENLATNVIQPLDANGNPDPTNGKIVMISVGMSNTTQEFDGSSNAFKPRADADPSKNPKLTIVDGAQGGKPASDWVDPNAPTWAVVDQRLAAAGVTPKQVEVAWVKQADAYPNQYGAFPAHAQHLQSELAAIARNLHTRYPNVQIAYYSSRTMSYSNDANGLNPEPFAYEGGFSTKWLIQDQLGGDPNLNFDPSKGPVVAPYLSWASYLWADGTNPRSDGFIWQKSDLQNDLTHPSPSGVKKVADQLLAFFKTDPIAAPWFLRQDVIGQAPKVRASAYPTSGTAPLTVNFHVMGRDLDGTITGSVWTYDDGTFAYNQQNPAKTFPAPGTYHAHVTVTDNSGNAVTRNLTITVSPGPAPGTPPRELGTALLRSGSAAGMAPVGRKPSEPPDALATLPRPFVPAAGVGPRNGAAGHAFYARSVSHRPAVAPLFAERMLAVPVSEDRLTAAESR
jgi:hypothetical protein